MKLVWSGALGAALASGCAPHLEPLEVSPGEPEHADGKADNATPRTELKVTLDPKRIPRARATLSLVNASSQTRRIWFYDTPALDVFEAGTILRAREIDDGDDDSTVKLRPFALLDLDPTFQVLQGLKCEVDRMPSQATPACSLTGDQSRDEIVDVGDGIRAIDKLFTSDQEALFAGYGPAVDWTELVALGPIAARVWTIRTKQVSAKITAELWYMPDLGQVLELSMKVPADEADQGLEELLDFIARRGLSADTAQETKTRRALEQLVAHSY